MCGSYQFQAPAPSSTLSPPRIGRLMPIRYKAPLRLAVLGHHVTKAFIFSKLAYGSSGMTR